MIVNHRYIFFTLLAPWLFVFSLRAMGPIRYEDISELFLLFLLCFIFFTLLGYIIGASRLNSQTRIKTILKKNQHGENIRREIDIVTILTLLYVTLAHIDFFFLKGGTLSTITIVRESDNITGSRMSILGGVISVASAAPFILLCMLKHQRVLSNQSESKFKLTLALGGIATSFLSGGRNGFLIGMVIYFFHGFLLKKFYADKKYNKKNRNDYTAKFFICAGILFSFFLFSSRELNQGIDSNQLLSFFAIKWNVRIDEYNTNNIFFEVVYATVTIFIFYLTHALNFIDQYTIDNFSPILMGAYNFPVPSKIIDVLFSTTISSNVSNELLVPGVYLTLPGSLYVDLGYFGTIFAGFLGGIITGLANKIPTRKIFLQLQLLSFMTCTWVLAPLYFTIGISNGFSFIVIMIFLLIRSIIKKRKLYYD